MKRHFTTMIAAVAMLGFVGAASVNAQAQKNTAPQADDNKTTNPSGKTTTTQPTNQPAANPKNAPNPNLPKGKNAPQADDNKDQNPNNPSGKSKK